MNRVPGLPQIDFKIATTAFKMWHYQQPSHLAEILPEYMIHLFMVTSILHDHLYTFEENVDGNFTIIFILIKFRQ